MSYHFVHLSSDDVPAMLALQEEAFAHLPSSTWLRRNSAETFRQCTLPPHAAVGARTEEGTLVAFALLYVPTSADDPERLATLLPKAPAVRTANSKLCIVHPHHRGQHLAAQLGTRLEAEALRQGIGLLCATASPHNEPSRRALEGQGYHACGAVSKYGFDRLLYCKPLH